MQSDPNQARKRSEAAKKGARTRAAQKHARELYERRQAELSERADGPICDGEFAGPNACVCGHPERHA